jgi:hypothetical protein
MENNIHSIASNHNTKRKKERKSKHALKNKQTNMDETIQTSSKFQELSLKHNYPATMTWSIHPSFASLQLKLRGQGCSW